MSDEIVVYGHRTQLDFSADKSVPFLGYVGGRGSGKSTAAAMRLYRWSMEEPGVYGMYAPTHPLLRDTVQRAYLDIAKHHILSFNTTVNEITMSSGSLIICRSLHEPERARGPSLRGAVWDEASLNSKAAYDILIGCLRYEGFQGHLACTFTPKPGHWTTQLFNKKINGNNPDVKCYHSRTRENPFLPASFEATLRRQYTTAFAKQELDGEFVDLSGMIMKRTWFKIQEVAPEITQKVRYWDLAATPVDTSKPSHDPDWTAGALLGKTKDKGWILLDMRRARLSPRENEELVAQTAAIDGKQVKIVIEQEPGASGKSLVDHYIRNIVAGYNVTGHRPSGDKVTRAMPFAAQAEAGNVILLEGHWNKEFLDEVEMFSYDSEHDDQIDASSGAFNALGGVNIIRPTVGIARPRIMNRGLFNGELQRSEVLLDIAKIISQAKTRQEQDELLHSARSLGLPKDDLEYLRGLIDE